MNRTLLHFSALATLTSFGLVQLGCGSPEPADSAEGTTVARPTTAAVAHDGETLFRGIFFGKGPASTAVPELDRAATVAPREVSIEAAADGLRQASADYAKDGLQRTSDELMQLADRVEKSSPGDLAARAMTDEDIETVQTAMLGAIKVSDPTFFNRFAADLQSGQQWKVERALKGGAAQLVHFGASVGGTTSSLTQPGATITLNYGLVIAVVAVAVIAVAVLIFVVPEGGSDSALEREELIDRLTIRFARGAE